MICLRQWKAHRGIKVLNLASKKNARPEDIVRLCKQLLVRIHNKQLRRVYMQYGFAVHCLDIPNT